MRSPKSNPAPADCAPLAAVDEEKAEPTGPAPFGTKAVMSNMTKAVADNLQDKPPMSPCKILAYCVTPGAAFGAGTATLLAIFLKSSLAALIPGGAAVGAIAGWSVAYLLRNNSNSKPQTLTSATSSLLDGQTGPDQSV